MMETRGSVRETSMEAYKAVMSSGYVARKNKEVYEGLFKHGPATGSELFYALGWNKNVTHSNIVTRLGELRDAGLVIEMGKDVCRRSGYKALVWDVTENHPKPKHKVERVKCSACRGTGYVAPGDRL